MNRYNLRRRYTSLGQFNPVDLELQCSNQNAVFAKPVSTDRRQSQTDRGPCRFSDRLARLVPSS